MQGRSPWPAAIQRSSSSPTQLRRGGYLSSGRSSRNSGHALRGGRLSRANVSTGPAMLSLRRQRRLGGALERLAGDHDLLHFAGALVDAQAPDVAIELLDLDALGDAEPAVDLHGPVD